MKHLIGKDVFVRPTGNEARYTDKPYLKAKVVSVARVYAEITFEGCNFPRKYRIKEGLKIEDDYNGGFVIYETEQAIKDFLEKQELASLIYSNMNQSELRKLSIDTLKLLKKEMNL